jgi:hypothetical protein
LRLLFGEQQKDPRLFGQPLKPFVVGDLVLQAFLLAEQGLSRLGVLPEIRFRALRGQFVASGAQAREVKDASRDFPGENRVGRVRCEVRSALACPVCRGTAVRGRLAPRHGPGAFIVTDRRPAQQRLLPARLAR